MSLSEKLQQIATLDLSGVIQQIQGIANTAGQANEAARQAHEALREAGKVSASVSRSEGLFGAPDGWAEAQQQQAQAVRDFIAALAASGDAEKIANYRAQLLQQITERETELKKAEAAYAEKQRIYEDQLQRNPQGAGFYYQGTVRNYRGAMEGARDTLNTLEKRLALLDSQRTARGADKTYKIEFTTASGQTKTLTTTQDPEDFIKALEAAQRRSL